MKTEKKQKYNYLDKRGTYATKRDFIETDYIDGVYNENGEQVIRPLTEEEKEVLAQFYKETVHAKPEINDKTKNLTARIRSALSRHSEYKKATGKYHPYVKKLLREFKKEREKLGNMYCDFFEAREIFSDNYRRNSCMYNKISNSPGMLVEFSEWFSDTEEGEDIE